MTVYDLINLAIENYFMVEVWSIEEEKTLFIGDVYQLMNSRIPILDCEIMSWGLDFNTEADEAMLVINIDNVL